MEGESKLQRLRIHHSKQACLRYTGTLDFQHIWERSVRRTGLKLAYTMGFNPTPRIQLAVPLALGFSSICELADIWLKEPVHPADAIRRLATAFPAGVSIQTVEELPLPGKALPALVRSVEYELNPLETPLDMNNLKEKIDQFLSLESFLHRRRGKEYNLRCLVLGVTIQEEAGGFDQPGVRAGRRESDKEINHKANLPAIRMHLTATEGATGRPDAVLEALELDPFAFSICRTAIHLN